MPRTPKKSPPPTPSRRSARIKQRKSLGLASATPDEMALRILKLEDDYEELASHVSNLSGSIESQLPDVTVSLLTDGLEESRDEMQEVRNEMATAMQELKEAKVSFSLSENSLVWTTILSHCHHLIILLYCLFSP